MRGYSGGYSGGGGGGASSFSGGNSAGGSYGGGYNAYANRNRYPDQDKVYYDRNAGYRGGYDDRNYRPMDQGYR